VQRSRLDEVHQTLLELPPATLDDTLKAAARSVGVSLYGAQPI
jgi:hypothetical protein